MGEISKEPLVLRVSDVSPRKIDDQSDQLLRASAPDVYSKKGEESANKVDALKSEKDKRKRKSTRNTGSQINHVHSGVSAQTLAEVEAEIASLLGHK